MMLYPSERAVRIIALIPVRRRSAALSKLIEDHALEIVTNPDCEMVTPCDLTRLRRACASCRALAATLRKE